MIEPTPKRCKCGRMIVFRPHVTTHKSAPITADPDPKGNLIVLDTGEYTVARKDDPPGDRYLNHFVDCPLANRFHRK